MINNFSIILEITIKILGGNLYFNDFYNIIHQNNDKTMQWF